MIQVNELRVGIMLNVLNPFTNEWKIEAIKGKTIMNFHENPTHELMVNNFKPIPLTEEILLKCGAKKTDKEDSFGGFIIYYPNGNGMRIKNNEWSNQHITVKIEFLHQLQNLYWCLCGKELTFNNL